MILAWQNRIAARGGKIQSRLLPSDTAKTVVFRRSAYEVLRA